jgi:hypothetical protein
MKNEFGTHYGFGISKFYFSVSWDKNKHKQGFHKLSICSPDLSTFDGVVLTIFKLNFDLSWNS